MNRHRAHLTTNSRFDTKIYEVTVCAGLEKFVQRELRRTLKDTHALTSHRCAGEVTFSYDGSWKKLLNLKTVHELFAILAFDVERPRGLLEPRTIQEITTFIKQIAIEEGAASFSLSAAGSDSKDLIRLKEAIANKTNLREDVEHGAIRLRLRNSKLIEGGWELLVRLGGKPLSSRSWRTKDFRGALSAPLARVMLELLAVQPTESFLDPMCGSGTLIIEQLLLQKPKKTYCIDIATEQIELTKHHLQQVPHGRSVEALCSDAQLLPFSDTSIDAVAINPPWGEAISHHGEKSVLFENLFKELSRVLTMQGRIVVISPDASLITSIASRHGLKVIGEYHALQKKGYHPTILHFSRSITQRRS